MTLSAIPTLTEFASAEPMSVGAVPWPADAPDLEKLTLVIKVTLAVDPSGFVRVLSPGRPLSLDDADSDGELYYPSDFAPYKPRCDIVIIEGDVKERAGEATLSCGPLVKNAREGARLGARELFVRSGDPTEPSAMRAWSSGQIDFSRFQCAPPDQRVDGVGLPLNIEYRRNDVYFATSFHGPAPDAAILDRSGWIAPRGIPLGLDTVGIAPSLHLVTLVWRGVCTLTKGGAPLIAVGLGPLRSRSAQEILRWPLRPLSFPRELRNRVSVAQGGLPLDTGTVDMISEESSVEEVTRSDLAPPPRTQGDLFTDRTSSDVTSRPQKALPFATADKSDSPNNPQSVHPRELIREVLPASPWQAETSVGFLIPRGAAPVVPPPSLNRPESAPPPVSGSWGVPSYMARGVDLAPEAGMARPEHAAIALPKPEPTTETVETEENTSEPAPVVEAQAAPSDTIPDEHSMTEEPLPIEAFPLERCAKIAASIAANPAETKQILAESELTPPRFAALEQHWSAAILADGKEGKVELMRSYDFAYVTQIEAERGAIEVEEYARIVVAGEKDTLDEVLADLDIPRAALLRIQRVWLKRITGDMAFGKSVNQAIKKAR